MNTDKKILIHQLDTGYMIIDYISGRKHGKETAEGVIEVIKKILGITSDKIELIPPVVISETAIAQQQQLTESESEAEKPTSMQKIKELAEINKKDGLLIKHFDYDETTRKEIKGYTNIYVVELEDGRAVIIYRDVVHYYTTKEKMMQIKYPIPYKYFTGKGLSTTAITCLRAYRSYLNKEEKKTQGDENGTCDDVTFDECANNSPENCKICTNKSRFEDKKSILANKPASPILKTTIGL